jgi:hypothetical protein
MTRINLQKPSTMAEENDTQKPSREAVDPASAGSPFVVPERNAQKLIALFQSKYCLGDKGSMMTSEALDKMKITPLSAARLVAYLKYTTFEIEEWIEAN